MRVFVSSRQRKVPISSSRVKRIVRFLLDKLSVSTDFVYVHFVGPRTLARMHDELFQDPSLTDTITVPIDFVGELVTPHVLGEAFIDPLAAYRFLSARNREVSEESLYEEISRYVVHSILHLVGYDDINPEDRKKMKKRENTLLLLLKKNNLLLNNSDV